MEPRLPIHDWIRKQLADASIREEELDVHAHGVLMQIGSGKAIPLQERYDPVTESEFNERYGAHVRRYLELSENGKKTIAEKPPMKNAKENDAWFGNNTRHNRN